MDQLNFWKYNLDSHYFQVDLEKHIKTENSSKTWEIISDLRFLSSKSKIWNVCGNSEIFWKPPYGSVDGSTDRSIRSIHNIIFNGERDCPMGKVFKIREKIIFFNTTKFSLLLFYSSSRKKKHRVMSLQKKNKWVILAQWGLKYRCG